MNEEARQERERILAILSAWDSAHASFAYHHKGQREADISLGMIDLMRDLADDIRIGRTVEQVRDRIPHREGR